MFTICSLHVHYMFTTCSLYVHYMFTTDSLYAHYMFTIYSLYYSLYIRYIFIGCSLYIRYVFTIYSLSVHYIFTICSRYVHYWKSNQSTTKTGKTWKLSIYKIFFPTQNNNNDKIRAANESCARKLNINTYVQVKILLKFGESWEFPNAWNLPIFSRRFK